MQINFGVILNESLADAVKITVIATGFQPANEPLPDRRAAAAPPIRLQPAPAEPARPDPIPEPVPIIDPEPRRELIEEAEPMLDLDDLDTPAYLRQGRLLN